MSFVNVKAGSTREDSGPRKAILCEIRLSVKEENTLVCKAFLRGRVEKFGLGGETDLGLCLSSGAP